MKALVVKAVPKLKKTLQYNLFGFALADSVIYVQTKTMIKTQAINKIKSDYISTKIKLLSLLLLLLLLYNLLCTVSSVARLLLQLIRSFRQHAK